MAGRNAMTGGQTRAATSRAASVFPLARSERGRRAKKRAPTRHTKGPQAVTGAFRKRVMAAQAKGCILRRRKRSSDRYLRRMAYACVVVGDVDDLRSHEFGSPSSGIGSQRSKRRRRESCKERKQLESSSRYVQRSGRVVSSGKKERHEMILHTHDDERRRSSGGQGLVLGEDRGPGSLALRVGGTTQTRWIAGGACGKRSFPLPVEEGREWNSRPS